MTVPVNSTSVLQCKSMEITVTVPNKLIPAKNMHFNAIIQVMWPYFMFLVYKQVTYQKSFTGTVNSYNVQLVNVTA